MSGADASTHGDVGMFNPLSQIRICCVMHGYAPAGLSATCYFAKVAQRSRVAVAKARYCWRGRVRSAHAWGAAFFCCACILVASLQIALAVLADVLGCDCTHLQVMVLWFFGAAKVAWRRHIQQSCAPVASEDLLTSQPRSLPPPLHQGGLSNSRTLQSLE
jgi:hypothetical protein